MRVPAGPIARRVEEMLTLLQMQGFGPRPVTQLSGGQRQRVALGRALAVDPSLLLLDEPMSNLDYKVRIELRHELRALQKRIGITAVYVTHDREEALTLADRIAVLDAGHVVQYGPPEQIFHQPASAFVAGFMGADNAIALRRGSDGTLSAARTMTGEPVTAHFRSDVARIDTPGGPQHTSELHLSGEVVQTLYVGRAIGCARTARTSGRTLHHRRGRPLRSSSPRARCCFRAAPNADRGARRLT
jgi:ABC-type Fe3+/spermidine/putrescine transport system ATPase subunit